MSYDLLACPVCDGETFSPLADGKFKAVTCDGCGLGIERHLSRSPAGAYARGLYDAAREEGKGSDRWARFHHDSAVALKRLAQLGPLLPGPGTVKHRPVWVDVGCGSGAFLAAARRKGWAAVGVEADETAAREVTDVLGLVTMTFPQWAAVPAQVDVVSFFDSLEHMLDPVSVLRTAVDKLRPGGLLVVEVPDLASTNPAAFARGEWRHRRVSDDFVEHQWHFSRRSLTFLAHRYLPDAEETAFATPVPTKLQMVWRRRTGVRPDRTVDGGPPLSVEHRARVTASQLLMFQEAARQAQLDLIKAEDKKFFDLVTAAINEHERDVA